MPDGETVDALNEGFEAAGDQLNFHTVVVP
jgi:hypothetical protein